MFVGIADKLVANIGAGRLFSCPVNQSALAVENVFTDCESSCEVPGGIIIRGERR